MSFFFRKATSRQQYYLSLDALELHAKNSNDDSWLPKATPSAALVDMARREWEELTDCPERSRQILSVEEESIVYAVMCFCDSHWNARQNLFPRLMGDYGFQMQDQLPGGRGDLTFDLLGFRACMLAHKHGMIDAWGELHSWMCQRARFMRDQTTVKVCYKRLSVGLVF